MPYLIRLPLAVVGLTAWSLLVEPLHLVTARTARGRVWGLFHLSLLLLVAGGAPFLFAGVWRKQTGAAPFDPTPWMAVELVGGVGLLAAAAGVAWHGRGGRTAYPPGSGLCSVGFWLWDTGWRRGYTGKRLPETDLVRLGVAVATRADPRMTRADARTVRAAVRPLLAAMDADPAYSRLIPAYQWASLSLTSRRPARFHLFAYTPTPRPGRPGALVFLHGHGPNLGLYLHLLRGFADEHGLVVIAPTFGYGNWEHPDGVEAVRWALDGGDFAPARVFLGGVSQGGAGVVRAAAAMPERFAGLLLLSPTLEPVPVAELARVWANKPVFVAQGGRDRNVRPGPVLAAAETLRAGGADVTLHFDPAADHALFLTRRAEVLRAAGDWLPG